VTRGLRSHIRVAQEFGDQAVGDFRLGQREHMAAFAEFPVLPMRYPFPQHLNDLANGSLRMSGPRHQGLGMNVGSILPSRLPEYSIPFMAVGRHG
jgi:hypothetical protein